MYEPTVVFPSPHEKQEAFINCLAKRVVVRAGRRSGKTVGMSIRAGKKFLAGRRVLYGAPTTEQIDRFWTEINRSLAQPIEEGIFRVNHTRHIIEFPGTESRIKAKTCWNADTLRGDYADELILDEYQLMDETAWSEVGVPMLLDNNGDATFIYTPPSLHSRSATKARDPQHAAKLFKLAAADKTGRWATFHFSSRDNPYISREALDEIAKDMTALAYRQEIMAEDIDEAPGALWTRATIENNRVILTPDFSRVVVGVDPSTTTGGDEWGVITAGCTKTDFYPISDDSVQGSPLVGATAAVTAYYKYKADLLVYEANQGGEMVALTVKQVDPKVRVKSVTASRGKQLRAEPIAALYEQGRGHHVGSFPALEDEMCLWLPGDPSPNRLDAMVHAATELMLNDVGWLGWAKNQAEQVDNQDFGV